MGKIAFVFAGQGAQAPGMGRALYDEFECAREVFETIDSIRRGTSAQCFEGTEEELKITANTQPCLYAAEMAAAAALGSAGIAADMAAGFSLGELSALTYAGAMDLETGTALVKRRAELMQEDSLSADTAMVAVVKLANEEVERVCSGFERVYPVNYNCPGQVTCSGAADEMEDFSLAVKEAGGRAIPINVSGAFHSPFMNTAAGRFRELLETVKFERPKIPVYSDYLAEPYGEDVAGVLGMQIDNPVRWEKIIRNMISEGADTFIELGPGRTLSNFIKKTNQEVRTFKAEDKEGIANILSQVKIC